jgi:hypothetical protein
MTGIMDRYAIWKRSRDISHRNDTAALIDLPSHNVSENRRMWDGYDWSKGGEEWTLDAKSYKGMDPQKWKTTLINEMMLKYI